MNKILLEPGHRSVPDSDDAEQVRGMVEGWRESLRIHERLRRLEEGRPLLELMMDKSGSA